MEIEICVGSYCHLKGSPRVADVLRALVKAHGASDKVSFSAKFCTGQCAHTAQESTVTLGVDGTPHAVDPMHIEDFFTQAILPRIS